MWGIYREAKHMRKDNRVNWRRLVFILIIFIIFGLGLAYLGVRFLGRLNFPISHSAPLAYLIVFGVAVVVNLSFIPLTFAISLMIIASTTWNPVLVALFGSLGASIGELSSYYTGWIGKRLAIPDDLKEYQRVKNWILQHGFWAIALLSFQPILPIEIGGFVAGAAKMPVKKFLPALWVGKFPKYLIFIYLGAHIINLLPHPH